MSVDLDRVADQAGSPVGGSNDYDNELLSLRGQLADPGDHRLFDDLQVKIVPDSEAHLQGCSVSTRLVENVELNELAPDETLCVDTSEGRGAIMKVCR
jgi:hypothetical protein